MESLKNFILGSIFTWMQALSLPLAASALLGAGLHYSGLAAQMSAVWWVGCAPLLYVVWLLLFCGLSAAEMQLLFRRYEKPRHMLAVDKTPEAARHFRLIICYLRAYLVRCLPLSGTVSYFPFFGKLFYLAYAPSVHIGERAFFAGFMYDPDLTDVGNDVVVGGNAVLSAHSMTTKGGNFTYVSARIVLGDRVTIGGESRLAMGVTVGADSIIEPFSNVTAMTYIPAGEVWGGNPAVFLRKRIDLPVATANDASSPPSSVPVVAQEPKAAVDPAAAARRVVRQALNLPAEFADDHPAAEFERGEWDSLVQLAIAATLADAYEVRLQPREITRIKNVADVANLIAAKLATPTDVAAPAATVALPSDPEWLPLLPSADATRLLAQAARPCVAGSSAPLKVVVAASFTAEPLASSLTAWTGAFDITTEVEFYGFNQIAQALLSPDSPFRSNASGLNVVLLRPEDLPEEAASAREAAGALLGAMRAFAESGSGTLVVGTLPPPISTTFTGDRSEVDALRTFWSEELKTIAGVVRLDFAGVIERIGIAAAGDVAMELATRAPFSAAAFRELGIELARIVRCQRRPRAKVLALDCDNTLWGGVLGEEGFDGIEMGSDGPGRSFQAFQRALLQLKQQGVLLVLVSRNEEADVLDVLDRHPDMLIRRSDVVGWRINWQPKSQNLQELAAELNLGLDAFVFIDDDSAQRLQVETALPAVHVFPTPSEPAQYAAALRKLWIFDAQRLTDEDLGRTEMMQQESARQRQRNSAADMETYLHSLGMQVEVREAEAHDLPRIAQLTQKTNQFNLSLRRRTLDEIKSLGSQYRTFVLSARDRFGDYGQVGACIVKHEMNGDAHLEIDTFLLSCRALGRGVEDALLHVLFDLARRTETPKIRAPFVTGPRNQPALEFFTRCGFQTETGDCFTAETALAFALPKHVQLDLDLRDAATAAT